MVFQEIRIASTEANLVGAASAVVPMLGFVGIGVLLTLWLIKRRRAAHLATL